MLAMVASELSLNHGCDTSLSLKVGPSVFVSLCQSPDTLTRRTKRRCSRTRSTHGLRSTTTFLSISISGESTRSVSTFPATFRRRQSETGPPDAPLFATYLGLLCRQKGNGVGCNWAEELLERRYDEAVTSSEPNPHAEVIQMTDGWEEWEGFQRGGLTRAGRQGGSICSTSSTISGYSVMSTSSRVSIASSKVGCAIMGVDGETHEPLATDHMGKLDWEVRHPRSIDSVNSFKQLLSPS